MLPAPMSPIFWRTQKEIYRLLGSKCLDCGHVTYPRRKVCPMCGGLNHTEHKLSKTGTIHTYTINYVVPAPIVPPVALCVVDLDGGGKYQALMSGAANVGDIKIGDRVELVLRKLYRERGVDVYAYKLRLVQED